MSDFNTMFDEQMMAQDYSDGSYRILEAMLKRDNLEIQYRKQGYSESQIAQFHEAATAQINEAMGDRWAQAKGAMSRGWGKVKAAGKWIWQKIKEMWAKFVAFLKKVWMKIRNLFSKDEDFAKRYKGTILHSDSLKYYKENNVTIKLLTGAEASNFEHIISKIKSDQSRDYYDGIAKQLYSHDFSPKEVDADASAINLALDTVTNFGKDSRKKMVEDLTKKADSKQSEIDKFEKGNMSDEEAKKKVDSLAGELKAYRAAANLAIRYYKKSHTLAKAAIIHLASKVKAVKESTIAFMIESAVSELNREYAPILEATDGEESKSDSSSSSDDKKLEYRKWDSGKGFKGKMGVIWDNIKMFFKKMWNWITTKCKAAWAWIKKQWEKLKAWWNKKDSSSGKDEKDSSSGKSSSRTVNVLISKSTIDQYTDFISRSVTRDLLQGEYDQSLYKGERPIQKLKDMMNQMYERVDSGSDQVLTEKEFDQYLNSYARLINVFSAKVKEMDGWLKDIQEHKSWDSNLQNTITALKEILVNGQKTIIEVYQSARRAVGKVDPNSKTESMAIENLTSDMILEAYELQTMAEADAVDDVIDSATNNGYGIDDVNHSSLDVLGSASTDPFALDYEKTNTFSQTVDMGDEGTAGWVDSRIGDTTTHVGSGLETPSVTREAYELNDDFRELDNMLYGYAY